MDYNLKIVIGGVELPEAQDITEGTTKTPSITNVTLVNSACSETMELGATASDRLIFTIINPEKTAFDGDTVLFYIQETETTKRARTVEIEEIVGTATAGDFIFPENEFLTEEDSEDEEPISPEDEAEAEAVDEALTSGLDLNLEGEFEEETTETLPDGESTAEWKQVGVYYVLSQVNNSDGSIMIICYDGFCKMNAFYYPTEITATVADMYADLQSQALQNCGITISDQEFDDGIEDMEISINFSCTYREAMGYFAGLCGGFAEFDQDGACGISQYTFDENNVIDSELISYRETSAGEMVVESLACNRTRNALNDDILESGSGGQDILFTNPFMTQEILDSIFSTYQGMRFVGAVSSVNWDSRMNAGEFVRIFTDDEYANYIEIKNNLDQNAGSLTEEEIKELRAGMNQLGKVILISSQTIDFKGDAITTITSVCESEATKANKPSTDVATKFRQVYEDTMDTKYLAEQAREYSEQANGFAIMAGNAAETAYASATVAINQLSVVEDIIGVLELISNNGEYELTTDSSPMPDKWYFIRTGSGTEADPYKYEAAPTEYGYNLTQDIAIDPGKTYYTRTGSGTSEDPYVYTEVEDPDVADIGTYYELETPASLGYYELIGVDKAIQNYVSSHLVLDDQGLNLQNDKTRLLLSTTEGLIMYNQSGDVIARYGSETVIGNGDYKVKLTPTAMTFIDHNVSVASVSQSEMVINNTRVNQSMRMGNFVWTINNDGRLILKYSEG